MHNTDFVKRLLTNLRTSCYYPIKRSFGKTLQNCDMTSLIAYTKLSKSKDPIEQNIEFLVAGLCYNSMKPDSNIGTNLVNYETVLKRLNREVEVENFLKLRYDNEGYFAKRFYTLSKKVIPLLGTNERFNYEQLVEDLLNWNKNNNAKIRWAMSIVDFNNEKEGK